MEWFLLRHPPVVNTIIAISIDSSFASMIGEKQGNYIFNSLWVEGVRHYDADRSDFVKGTYPDVTLDLRLGEKVRYWVWAYLNL